MCVYVSSKTLSLCAVAAGAVNEQASPLSALSRLAGEETESTKLKPGTQQIPAPQNCGIGQRGRRHGAAT